jgi:hypothetical protein
LGAVAKHRAGDIEQPIADRAEGTYVAVAALAQSGVLAAAATTVLHGNARPVVEGILEPRITGEPSRDDAALAGALGHRCSATKSPQGVIVSSLEASHTSASSVAKSDRFLAGMRGSQRRAARLPVRFALHGLGHRRPHSLSSWRCASLKLRVTGTMAQRHEHLPRPQSRRCNIIEHDRVAPTKPLFIPKPFGNHANQRHQDGLTGPVHFCAAFNAAAHSRFSGTLCLRYS